jgi:hypothetical protein
MAACAKLTYNQVSQEAWQCIKQAVEKYDVTVSSDTGTASKDGLTLKKVLSCLAPVAAERAENSSDHATCMMPMTMRAWWRK